MLENHKYPEWLTNLPACKAEREIVAMTYNSNGNRFSKSVANHVKPDEYGSFQGKLHSATAAARLRLDLTWEWARRKYRETKWTSAVWDMVQRAEKIYTRCLECQDTLNSRWRHFEARRIEKTCWITAEHAKEFINRARSRSDDVDLKSIDLMQIAEARCPDAICPVFGTKIKRFRNVESKPQDTSASLHRVDASLGYHADNVMFCSTRANSLIRDMSSLELRIFANRVEDKDKKELYETLAEGQARMEQALDITPAVRGSWQVNKAEWFDYDSGKLIYTAPE